MKAITKKQQEILKSIEELIDLRLTATGFKRNIFFIDLVDSRNCSESLFFGRISQICEKYNIGKVEPNGCNKLAIIH